MDATPEPKVTDRQEKTFGEQLFAALAARRGSDGKIPREVWVATANELFEAVHQLRKRTRKPKGAPRARNPLWDTLATECGMKLEDITRIPAKAIGVALADILAVSPEVTPDEIRRRVQGYRRQYPSVACTPFALASHWAEFGTAKPGRINPRDIYREPPPEWRQMCIRRWPDALEWGNSHDFANMPWKDVSTTLRPDILKLFAQEASA
jgi:hypothetical protein